MPYLCNLIGEEKNRILTMVPQYMQEHHLNDQAMAALVKVPVGKIQAIAKGSHTKVKPGLLRKLSDVMASPPDPYLRECEWLRSILIGRLKETGGTPSTLAQRLQLNPSTIQQFVNGTLILSKQDYESLRNELMAEAVAPTSLVHKLQPVRNNISQLTLPFQEINLRDRITLLKDWIHQRRLTTQTASDILGIDILRLKYLLHTEAEPTELETKALAQRFSALTDKLAPSLSELVTSQNPDLEDVAHQLGITLPVLQDVLAGKLQWHWRKMARLRFLLEKETEPKGRSFPELSKELGVSRRTLAHWAYLLGIQPHTEAHGLKLLTPQETETLRKMVALKETYPKVEARAQAIKGGPLAPNTSSPEDQYLVANLASALDMNRLTVSRWLSALEIQPIAQIGKRHYYGKDALDALTFLRDAQGKLEDRITAWKTRTSSSCSIVNTQETLAEAIHNEIKLTLDQLEHRIKELIQQHL